jgi:hypothetical protein
MLMARRANGNPAAASPSNGDDLALEEQPGNRASTQTELSPGNGFLESKAAR